MIQLGVIDPFQVILITMMLGFPVILFLIGYYVGKKEGYKTE